MQEKATWSLDENHIRRNVIGGYIGRVSPIVVGLITAPILTRYLDKEAFGLWTILIGLVAVLPIGDLGVGSALIIRISQALGNEDNVQVRRLVACGLVLQLTLGLLMAAVTLLIIPNIPWVSLLNIKSDHNMANIVPTAIVMFTSYCLLIPLNLGQQLLIAHQENVRNSLVMSLGYIANLLSTLLFVYLKLPLPWIAFAAAGLPGLVWLTNLLVELMWRKRHLVPQLKDDLKFEIILDILRLGVKLLASQTMRILLLSDAIIVGISMSASAASLYGQTQRFFFICSLGQYVSNAWIPALAGSFARNEESVARIFFQKNILKFSGSTLLLGILLAPIIREFLPWYLGEGYDAPAWSLVGGFVIWTVVVTIVDGLTAYSTASKYVKHHVFWLITATCFATAFKFSFANVFGYDAIIWSSVVGLALLYIVPMLVVTRTLNP